MNSTHNKTSNINNNFDVSEISKTSKIMFDFIFIILEISKA